MSPHSISDLTAFFLSCTTGGIEVAHPTKSIATWIEQARSRTQSKEHTILHYALLGNLRHKSPHENEFAKIHNGDDD